MINYILEYILITGIFFVAYKLFLENEKTNTFKRVYLLLSLIMPLIVPVISIPVSQEASVAQLILGSDSLMQSALSQGELIAPRETTLTLKSILIPVYCSVCLLFLYRFLNYLISIRNKIQKSESAQFQNAHIILVRDTINTYSFLNYIFLNAEQYKRNEIDNRILLHETAHTQQKHSWDILLLQVIIIIFWFNPFLHLLKKCIQLNHEFLADEFVISKTKNVHAYQHLILNTVTQRNNPLIASSFNYITLKKRITMITKTKSVLRAISKAMISLSVVSATILLLSVQSFAQIVKQPDPVQKQVGVTQVQLDLFKSIIKQNKPESNKWDDFVKNLSDEEFNTLRSIFVQMSREQQSVSKVVFYQIKQPLQKTIPSEELLQEWKDAMKYGIWIDGVRVDNIALDQYSPDDFSFYSVSLLMKNALNYGKHIYQLNLMTKSNYQQYYNEFTANKDKYHIAYQTIKKN